MVTNETVSPAPAAVALADLMVQTHAEPVQAQPVEAAEYNQ